MKNDLIKGAVLKHKEDILYPYGEILNLDGYDAICKFSHEFGGTSVYIPYLRTIFKQCLEKEIITQYNGRNIRELSKNYNFSERHIYNLIKG